MSVVLSMIAMGLVLVVSSSLGPSVSAHEQTERVRVRVAPFTEMRSVFNYVTLSEDVFNYEDRTRSVFNYVTLSEDVFNYEDRPVFNYGTRMRSVFNYVTLSEDVFNYETVCIWLGCYVVRVAPFTRQVQVRVAPYLEEYRVRVAPFTERVRVAPFTRQERVRVAPYLEEYRVRVAPFTRQVQVRVPPYLEEVPAFNYEWQNQPVAHTHTPEPTPCPMDRFDPSTGACWPDLASCGDDHTHGGSECHDPGRSHAGECATGTELVVHSDCIPVSTTPEPTPVVTPEPTPCPMDRFDPSTGACWPDPGSCGDDHTHNGSACHDPHRSHEGDCVQGTVLSGHSDCIPVSTTPEPTPVVTPEPTPCPMDRFDPSTGACWPDPDSCGDDHTHNGSACHDPHRSHEGDCVQGTVLSGHSDCIPVSTTPEPTPVVTPVPTPEPTPVVTPEPTPEPTPVVTPVPTPEPTPVVTPEPTPVVTPEPTPTPVVTPEPTVVPAPHGLQAVCTHSGRRITVRFVGVAEANTYLVSGFPEGLRTIWRGGAGLKQATFAYGISPGVAYDVEVQAVASEGGTSGPSSVRVVCKRPAPTVVFAECVDDENDDDYGKLEVRWIAQGTFVPRAQFEVEVDGAVLGDTVRYLFGSFVESYVWDGAQSNRAHRVRVRTVSTAAGVALGENAESEWSTARTAGKCAVFKPSADGFSGSCNSHGVVHLDWDPVNGADRYDVNYAADDTLANPDPNTDSIRYEGPATEVYAQRWEGETYKFRVRARARTGQRWSGWTEPKTVECDPLAPVMLTANRAVGVSPLWASPNGSWVNLSPGRQWIAPQVLRYMADDTKDPNLGRDNCSAIERNRDDDGWIRTCTFNWSEPFALRLDQDTARKMSHLAFFDHSVQSHLHVDANGDPSTAEHRHCNADSDGDGVFDGDGTCPGSNDPNFPWHPTLPGLDDSFWNEAIASGVIGGAVSEGLSYGTAALAGLRLAVTTGTIAVSAGIAFVGVAAGVFVAWLLHSNSRLHLVMNASTGCVDLSRHPEGGRKWTKDTAEIEYTVQESSYETKMVHQIDYCIEESSEG